MLCAVTCGFVSGVRNAVREFVFRKPLRACFFVLHAAGRGDAFFFRDGSRARSGSIARRAMQFYPL